MPREDYTDLTVVLDRSGSMASIREDMQGGFDAFIDDQKKLPGELRVTLYQFDDQYEKVYECQPVASVPKLRLNPRGMTALLDAMGRSITATGERLAAMDESQRPGKILFVAITDGHENASKEFRREQIKKLIEQQAGEYNWAFTYLGANVDAFTEAGGIGIAAASAMNYTPTKAGAANAYRGLSANVSNLRSGAVKSFSYSDDQRQAAMS